MREILGTLGKLEKIRTDGVGWLRPFASPEWAEALSKWMNMSESVQPTVIQHKTKIVNVNGSVILGSFPETTIDPPRYATAST